jgi:primosomal protein N' (replication factor Y)
MSLPFCNVALPVPLRKTFTYAVPESLREFAQPGARVLVPFRKKAMVGVVVELTDHAPEDAKIREITKALDRVPALTPKLIELGLWIANYYLAPVGEVFRAMLPPVVEMRTQRLIVLTERRRVNARPGARRNRVPRQTRWGKRATALCLGGKAWRGRRHARSPSSSGFDRDS